MYLAAVEIFSFCFSTKAVLLRIDGRLQVLWFAVTIDFHLTESTTPAPAATWSDVCPSSFFTSSAMCGR